MQQLLGAVHGNQHAMDQFVSVAAGSFSPADFFAPDNVEQIMAAACSGALGLVGRGAAYGRGGRDARAPRNALALFQLRSLTFSGS
jgi:hypothetical protein